MAVNLKLALAYALRFDARGKAWRADLALRDCKLGQPCPVAARLLAHLALTGYVVLQEPRAEAHVAPPQWSPRGW